MKKLFSIVISSIIATATLLSISANASTQILRPKAPKVSASLKPYVIEYKKGNYVGTMLGLEKLVKQEKNNVYAKYYLALCYTRLGYVNEAKILYEEVLKKDTNMALSYYSQKALNCLDDPNSAICNPSAAEENKEPEELTEMDKFIMSGRKVHPAAMDRITRERQERRLQEEEYIRQQQLEEEQNNLSNNNLSLAPTNEEIASALNTLSKIGMNPYNQFNPLAQSTQPNPLLQAQQFNQFGVLGMNNQNMYNSFLGGNTNPNTAQMMLYNQMMNGQHNTMNYGI